MKDRTVLVTGGSGGIGQEIVKRFVHDGYFTIIHYHSHAKRAEALQKELFTKGYENTMVVGADLTNPKEIDDLISTLEEKHIIVDILINNAGIKDDDRLEDMSDQQFKKVIEINVSAPFMLTKRIVPMMKNQRYGRIINISSGLAQHGGIGKINYGASKAAIENMTKNLAKELGPSGITVNTVAPGLIETEMTEDVTDKAKEEYISRVPIRRLVEAKDVAHACAFFADERSSAISNQVIGVNGGLR
ncbi:MAG: SDR family NAD(P)-dependent oxidoreductase [Candidatus Izemoplasma sp.]|nr:SDR family NAD(P)-dependent oxidoreductase [Candidatus Izemoplasma sp.]